MKNKNAIFKTKQQETNEGTKPHNLKKTNQSIKTQTQQIVKKPQQMLKKQT